jgi:hypothetical protein
MATEKQIAANRANAQKSTGPRTAAGRLKSSRNAFRHGLSLPLRIDMTASAKADAAPSPVIRPATNNRWPQPRWRRRSWNAVNPRGSCRADGDGRRGVGQPRAAAAIGGFGPLREVRTHQAPTGIAQTLSGAKPPIGHFFQNEPNLREIHPEEMQAAIAGAVRKADHDCEPFVGVIVRRQSAVDRVAGRWRA